MTMLIEIINCEDFENTNNIITITNLLACAREGNHILLADKEFYEGILTSEGFGKVERSVAFNLKERIREFKGITKILTLKIIVDFNYQGNPTNYINDGISVINLSYKYFLNSSSIQLTTLLCEDSFDYNLYQIISRYYKHENKINLKVNFKVSHGGGARTKREFDQNKNNNILCLCLLDNDKKHPQGPRGGTIGLFNLSNDFKLTSTVKAFDIGVHEIESLIPIQIIDQFIGEYEPENRRSHILLNKLIESDNSVKFYFDHKKGLKVKDIIKLDRSGTFWTPLVKSKTTNICLTRGECTCTEPCIIINGYGDNLLERSLVHLNHISGSKIKDQLHYLKEYWDDLGFELLNWGCCYEKIRY